MLTVYSKANCPFCDRAKDLLKNKNIEFTEVRVDLVPEAREFLVNSGHRSVPQIYAGDKLFVDGGFQGLQQLTETQLREKLNAIT